MLNISLSSKKRMPWFYLILFLSFIIGNLEAASNHHDKKHPSAVVVGTVYCDTCFQDDFSKASHFISGASVAVECKDGVLKKGFRQEVKTDEHGKFKVDLPFSVSKHVEEIKRCSVKLINSSEPFCAVASSATSSSLHLKARKQGVHIFSAGFFTFKPLKQPILCNQKPSLENSKTLNSEETSLPPIDSPSIFPPPIHDPSTPEVSPIPQLPRLPELPQLPPLPSLPGLPFLPPMPGNIPGKKPEEHSRGISETLAQEFIYKTPQHHSIFSHTVCKRTYIFLINDPVAYFVIHDEYLDKGESLWFLNRVKSAFDEIFETRAMLDFDNVTYRCFQSQFDGIFGEIMGSSSRSCSKVDRNSSVDSTKARRTVLAPLLGQPCKGLKKKKRSAGESEVMSRGINDFNGEKLDVCDDLRMHKNALYTGDRQRAKQIWKKHVWIVLGLDLIICAILFGIWLWVCRGFQCIDG